MSSSESEAPETVTLKTARSQSKKQNKELEERQKAISRVRKEKNKVKDARLKAENAAKKVVPSAQSKPTKQKGTTRKQGDEEEEAPNAGEERARLERRMEKAMASAREEDDSEDSDNDSDILMDEDHSNSTVSEESEDGESEDEKDQNADNPHYLPEHYFERSVPSSKIPPITGNAQSTPQRRKRKAKDRKKREERVIGSRAIYTLSSISPTAAGRTTPSVKAKRFLHRQLQGDILTKGWERRPVAIGSLASRARPAGKFVRG